MTKQASSFRPERHRRAAFASMAEQRRYQAWLAKHACQPAPSPTYSGPPSFVTRSAVDPNGNVAVFYYGTGTKTSPTSSLMWFEKE